MISDWTRRAALCRPGAPCARPCEFPASTNLYRWSRYTCGRLCHAPRPWCRPRQPQPRPAARHWLMARTSASSVSVGKPASRIKLTTMASGLAPDTARSLTVPLMASSPIEPPGKRSGFTTKLSVVIAIRTPPISREAASFKLGLADRNKRGANRPSTRRRLAMPPAPWAISICGSRNRIFGVVLSVATAIFTPATPGCSPWPSGVRNCSTLRTIPPKKPSTLPPDSRECTPCQTTCTAPA